jgi:hypothetical protein
MGSCSSSRLPGLVALETGRGQAPNEPWLRKAISGSSRNSRRSSSGEGAATAFFYSIPNPTHPGTGEACRFTGDA